jgi:hypothetical protein
MHHYYKSHNILITTWGRIDGFMPELRINKQLAPPRLRDMEINQPFPTEAARFALEVVSKPIPHKHGSK